MVRIAGLTPVPADVDPRTFNLDPAAFERAVTPRTVSVVPTHLYGLPCDMDAILAIARQHGLKVIEDCAHALGARYRGREVGTFGDASFFSFQTLKPLNCYGGGLALVNDAMLAARVRAQVDALTATRDGGVLSRRESEIAEYPLEVGVLRVEIRGEIAVNQFTTEQSP